MLSRRLKGRAGFPTKSSMIASSETVIFATTHFCAKFSEKAVFLHLFQDAVYRLYECFVFLPKRYTALSLRRCPSRNSISYLPTRDRIDAYDLICNHRIQFAFAECKKSPGPGFKQADIGHTQFFGIVHIVGSGFKTDNFALQIFEIFEWGPFSGS